MIYEQSVRRTASIHGYGVHKLGENRYQLLKDGAIEFEGTGEGIVQHLYLTPTTEKYRARHRELYHRRKERLVNR